jgi:putative membrane protein
MKKLILIGAASMIIAAISGCSPSGEGSGSGSVRNMNAGNRAGSNSEMNPAMNTAGNGANTLGNSAVSMTADSPEDFLHEAAQGGMAEVDMGRLAQQKAQSPEVKNFGQMMVSEHSKANEELKGIATKKNIPLPADLGPHKSAMDKLNGLSGSEFDKAYVEIMVDDHEKDVSAFQKQADGGKDPEVKAFAMKTLPTLKKHLDAINAIQAKMQ